MVLDPEIKEVSGKLVLLSDGLNGRGMGEGGSNPPASNVQYRRCT
ncbi:MAG: hypothetical protein AAFR31_18330 [Cyanobacteria bacterium J06627_8]